MDGGLRRGSLMHHQGSTLTPTESLPETRLTTVQPSPTTNEAGRHTASLVAQTPAPDTRLVVRWRVSTKNSLRQSLFQLVEMSSETLRLRPIQRTLQNQTSWLIS